jgi:hypothetical protein
VVVSFALSGVAYAGSIRTRADRPARFNAQGRLYYGDLVGMRILRSNPTVATWRRWPKARSNFRAGRRQGDRRYLDLCINENKFFHYSASETKRWTGRRRASTSIHHLRTDKTGAILPRATTA